MWSISGINIMKLQPITHRHAGLSLSAVPLLCLPFSLCFAADAESFTEEYFFNELPVVFSATRLAQTASETPVSMTVIDKEMIKASGAIEIADLMRLVPGMQVSNYVGNKYFVTYHGRADRFSRDLQVLIDGRSVYNPVFGGVSWNDIPLAIEDINLIEVIRGPNAAAYGSNSFAGVINIITEHPAQQHGTSLRTTIGDEGTRQIYARNAGAVGNLDYRLSVKYDESDGLKTRIDDSTTKWLSLRGDYQVDMDDIVMFQTGYSSGTQQEGFAETDGFEVLRDNNSSSSFQQIKWTHLHDTGEEYSLQFFHNYLELRDKSIFPYGGFDFTTGLGFEAHRYEVEFQHTLAPMPKLRVVWGAGLRHDSGKSPQTLNQSSALTRNQLHAFLNTELKPMDSVVVNLGAMVEKYEGFSGLFSPRIALNYLLNEDNTFRISHSRAYRMPNMWEESSDMVARGLGGAPIDLQLFETVSAPEPERIDAIELGYTAAFHAIPLTIDTKIFKEKINPIITHAWDADLHTTIFSNGGNVEIEGVEMEFNLHPTASTFLHAAYSLTDTSGYKIVRYDGGLPDGSSDLSESVPTKTYSLLASHRLDNGVQISTGFYHADKVTWTMDNTATDSYNKWDFRIAKEFKLSDATIDVSATVQNISDNNYHDYYQENDAQREFYLQLGLKF